VSGPNGKGREDSIDEESLPTEIIYLVVTTERIELLGRDVLRKMGYSSMAPTSKELLIQLLGLGKRPL
jgi:hypothetical protein